MATAGASSFSDVAEGNQYETAIDVLDALKVFIGYEDKTFKPDGELTRAEAAVLVYRIATGDVEGKYVDNYTYMANAKFDDLNGYNWARGYINYCQNAGIVVGTSATKFSPGEKVTGYQLMVMVLRTLGYGKAGEFSQPGKWELETASKCESLGMLKNVTTGDFGAPAKRAMVAEILFRGLLQPTVKYSALTPGGYTEDATTLGKQSLNLDDIQGVVVANRIADLYGSKPLADGKTRMIVDGKDYVIDMDTDATAIGLNHHAYVQNGKVLAGLEETGNTIGEPETAGAASKVADLAKDAGIKTTKDTEYYVNFDQNITGYSEWRLEYNVKFDDADDKAYFEDKTGVDLDDYFATVDTKLREVTRDTSYTLIIPRGNQITAADVDIMRGIFTYADNDEEDTNPSLGIGGYVYAGTNSAASTNRNLDLSDTMSWSNFYNDYILGSKTDFADSDNGEWLRVIDNNGDGIVDYVLRTDFVMTTVTDYEKRTDVYDVEWTGGLPNGNGKGTIAASDIVKASEDTDLSVGSVILYTLIDGKYYVSNPAVTTMTVDKKSVNSKAGTFTSDGETYTWSGIDEKAVRYYDSVSQLAYETRYDMYPDHFGFIRLATETSRNFVLLTDGYYATDNRTDVYKADLFDGETAVSDVEIVDKARSSDHFNDDGFIDTWENDHKGNASTWKRLNTFGEFYPLEDTVGANTYTHYVDKVDGPSSSGNNYYTSDPFHTNIALGSENEGVWTLEDVTELAVDYNGLYRDYSTYELKPGFGFKARDLWGITAWTDATTYVADQAVQVNGQTLYYYVENPGAKAADLKVQSWVGYQNAPEAVKDAKATRAYTVTHQVRINSEEVAQYVIADVVVIEGIPAKTVENPQLITTKITRLRENSLGKDSEGVYGEHDNEFKLFKDYEATLSYTPYDKEGLAAPQVTFYDPNDSEYITENFADYGIYAGKVTILHETKDDDYVEITPNGSVYEDRISFYTNDVAVYELDQITKGSVNTTNNLNAVERENIKDGDYLIVMCDADKNVKLVVNVSRSGKDSTPWRDSKGEYTGEPIAKLWELYGEVYYDNATPRTVSEKIAEAWKIWDDGNATAEDLEYIAELLESIEDIPDDLTAAELEKLMIMGQALSNGAITEAVAAEEQAKATSKVEDAALKAILAVIPGLGEDTTLDDIVDRDENDGTLSLKDDIEATDAQKGTVSSILDIVNTAVGTIADKEVPEENQEGTAEEQANAINELLDPVVEEAIGDISMIVDPSNLKDEETVNITNINSDVEGAEDVELTLSEDDPATEAYDNVQMAYTLTIPKTVAQETGKIEMDIAVAAGLRPYSSDSAVTFAPKATETKAVEEVVIWVMTINLNQITAGEDATEIPILFLNDGGKEPTVSVDVEIAPARLWDVEKGNDDGTVDNELYSSYTVRGTKDTSKEDTWNIDITARDVVPHKSGVGVGYWVGAAFLPTIAESNEIVSAKLYFSDGEGGWNPDNTVGFEEGLLIESGKGLGTIPSTGLIAEYWFCSEEWQTEDKNPFSTPDDIKLEWTVKVGGESENTVVVTQYFHVNFDVTKSQTAEYPEVSG